MSDSASGNVVVEPDSALVLLGPHGTMLRAREFLDASEFLRDRSPDFSPVSGFLACRAIELALKAYLKARGVPRVRWLGHDLTRLFIEANTFGLDQRVTLDSNDIALVMKTGTDYADHRLAYFDIAWAVVDGFRPDPKVLSRVATSLVTALEPVCRDVLMGDGDPLALTQTQ